MKKKIFIIGGFFLILDQILKMVIINSIGFQENISLIPNFLYLTNVKNTGGAWSLFDGNPILLIIIGLVCIVGLSYYIYKKNDYSILEVSYYGLITGGIFGNFIDRIFRGGVVDYIGLIFGNYYFPVFNLADICIVCGVGLLFIDSFRGDKNGIRSN